MDEPTLKVQVEPMEIGAFLPTMTSTNQKDYVAYPTIPTNQQYNMAGMSDSATMYHPREDIGLELDSVAVCTYAVKSQQKIFIGSFSI